MGYREIQITIYECICDKCGYIWRTKKERLPIFCPNKKCSSPTAWNKRNEVLGKKIGKQINEHVTDRKMQLKINKEQINDSEIKTFESVNEKFIEVENEADEYIEQRVIEDDTIGL